MEFGRFFGFYVSSVGVWGVWVCVLSISLYGMLYYILL